LRKVADHRNLELAALEGFDDTDNPKHKDAEMAKQSNDPSDHRHNRDDGAGDAQNRQSQTLEGVELYDLVLAVWLNDQKNDRRNNGDISETACNIVCQPASGSCRSRGSASTG